MGARLTVRNKMDFYKKFPKAPADLYEKEKRNFTKYAKRDEEGILGLNVRDWDRSLKASYSEKGISHLIFVAADRDRDDFVEWHEYISALGYIKYGTPKQRFRAVFELYDKDGDGALDKEELMEGISMSLVLNGMSVGTKYAEGRLQTEAKKRAQRIIDKYDFDGDATVDLDELYSSFQEDADLFNDLFLFILTDDDDAAALLAKK